MHAMRPSSSSSRQSQADNSSCGLRYFTINESALVLSRHSQSLYRPDRANQDAAGTGGVRHVCTPVLLK